MQQNKRVKSIMFTVSLLGSFAIFPLALLCSFNMVNRMSALYIWMACCFSVYLTSVLKSAYGEGRPFWESGDITPADCVLDLGNPSGHCLTASFILLTLYLNQYYEVGRRQVFRTIFCTGYIVKMGLTALLLSFLIMLMFSRVYLGEHSINQVIFGTSIGVVLSVSMHYSLKPFLKRMPAYLRERAVS